MVRRWKCSATELIPKGNLLKRYRPREVMNLVRREGYTMNPELASRFVKTRTPLIFLNGYVHWGKN